MQELVGTLAVCKHVAITALGPFGPGFFPRRRRRNGLLAGGRDFGGWGGGRMRMHMGAHCTAHSRLCWSFMT